MLSRVVVLTASDANFNVRGTRSTPATFRVNPKFPVVIPSELTDDQILETTVVNLLVLVHLALLGDVWLFELPVHWPCGHREHEAALGDSRPCTTL